MMRHPSTRGLALLALCVGATAADAGSPQGGDPADIGKLIVGGVALLVVLATIYYCIRCFRRPGERDTAHIKHRILQDDW